MHSSFDNVKYTLSVIQLITVSVLARAGALTLASSMLYPKTLAGAAVFSGWVPLDPPGFVEKITAEAKKVSILYTAIWFFFATCHIQIGQGVLNPIWN